MLNLGTFRNPGSDRILRFAYANGVRYFDTADTYGSEPVIARWLRESPEIRKELFLVTKEHPKTPEQFVSQLDKRLAAMGTDYVDLYLIHGIGNTYGSDYKSLGWLESADWKAAFEKIRKSGKAKLVGFSCHDSRRPEYLQAAASGGFTDAIMLQYTPWLAKDSALNKAIDACHKAGIGLISMKQISGLGDKVLRDVPNHVPYLQEKKLTAYQGLLHAIWSDERISSVCVSMVNTDQVRENSAALRTYEPMKVSSLYQLRDAIFSCNRTLCADCTGQCSKAAGTQARLDDLARLLTYYEHYGYRTEARRQYEALSAKCRDWSTADLAAAEAACPNRLKFSSILLKLDQYMA